MNIYIMASNQYIHLLPIYGIMLNKYWPGQNVIVLCYDIPNFDLPSNFSLVSLGVQTKDLSPVVNYFTNICTDDYFVMVLEDMILIDYVDQSIVDRLEQGIKDGADKAELHFYGGVDKVHDIANGMVEYNQDIDYRTSVHPAIWSREYLLSHLRPTDNWWSFETQFANTRNDGASIIATKEQSPGNQVYDTLNVYAQGKLQSNYFEVAGKMFNGIRYECDKGIFKKLERELEMKA